MARVNWLDSAIAFVAPAAGARRVKARSRFEQAKREYAGAALGRNTDGWRTAGTSADAEIAVAGGRLRDRSRDLVRNNPHAAKALTILADNIIGEGIMPRPATGSDKADNQAKEAFEEWSAQSDADGQLDFMGQQTLALREMVEAGEVLARRRWRLPKDGYAIPMQVQLLEADFLDDNRTGEFRGNRIVQGVELNLTGKRAAYWLWSEHPGSAGVFNRSFVSSPVAASEIAHLYEKQRTQTRGVPWAAPVIRRIRDIDDYDFAEGIRKKLEASLVAFVTTDEESQEGLADQTGAGGTPPGFPKVTDASGNLIEKIAPGLIAYLRGGKDVRFNAPATVGGYEEYKRVGAREVATGLRVPYELLTGDLSNVNFSSARVGLVEFRRFCGVVQWQIVIPMLLQPVWGWFCEAAYIAGRISTPQVRVEWAPPKWQAIEPYKDALADLITLRSGTRSWQDVVAQTGRNPADVLAEIAAWNKLLDQFEITLDSDPRRTSLKGALQKVLPGDDEGEAEVKADAAKAGDGGGRLAPVLSLRDGRRR